MAFLDYLLGGAAGGFEGYERKKAKDLQAQKEEEDRQIRQLALLNQLGFKATGLVRQTPDAAAQNIVSNIADVAPTPKYDTTVGRAFDTAVKRGMGVGAQAPGSFAASQKRAFDTAGQRKAGIAPAGGMGGISRPDLTETPTMAAQQPPARTPLLDSSRLDQFERAAAMQAASPEMQQDTPFGRLGFAPPESDEDRYARESARDMEKYKAQRGVLEEERLRTEDRANRSYFSVLQKAGRIPPTAEYEDYAGLEDGTFLKAEYDFYKSQMGWQSSERRAQIGGQSFSYPVGIDPSTGRPVIMQAPRRGGPLVSTGVAAPSAPATTDEEAEGIQFLQENKNNPFVISAYNAIVAADTAAARRPGLIGYGLKQKGRGAGGRAPTAPPPGAPGAGAARDTTAGRPAAPLNPFQVEAAKPRRR